MESIILNISNNTSDGIDVKNILLVDDEECTIFSLKALLNSQGYNVTIARNMKKVVGFYKANEMAIVLILIDISNPIIDGLEALIELKQFDHDLSFLVMSSY
jgi:CheY-like chemotaxis protein